MPTRVWARRCECSRARQSCQTHSPHTRIVAVHRRQAAAHAERGDLERQWPGDGLEQGQGRHPPEASTTSVSPSGARSTRPAAGDSMMHRTRTIDARLDLCVPPSGLMTTWRPLRNASAARSTSASARPSTGLLAPGCTRDVQSGELFGSAPVIWACVSTCRMSRTRSNCLTARSIRR